MTRAALRLPGDERNGGRDVIWAVVLALAAALANAVNLMTQHKASTSEQGEAAERASER